MLPRKLDIVSNVSPCSIFWESCPQKRITHSCPLVHVTTFFWKWFHLHKSLPFFLFENGADSRINHLRNFKKEKEFLLNEPIYISVQKSTVSQIVSPASVCETSILSSCSNSPSTFSPNSPESDHLPQMFDLLLLVITTSMNLRFKAIYALRNAEKILN